MRAPLSLVIFLFAFLGCSALTPSFTEDLDRRYNLWLGKTKADRVLLVGPPDRCALLRTGEEVCTWDRMSLDLPAVRRLVPLHIPASMDHVVFVYDTSGRALAWHYSGTWGERSSGAADDGAAPHMEALLP